jgi:hypothetical protein
MLNQSGMSTPFSPFYAQATISNSPSSGSSYTSTGGSAPPPDPTPLPRQRIYTDKGYWELSPGHRIVNDGEWVSVHNSYHVNEAQWFCLRSSHVLAIGSSDKHVDICRLLGKSPHAVLAIPIEMPCPAKESLVN